MNELTEGEKAKLKKAKFIYDNRENMLQAAWDRIRDCKHERIQYDASAMWHVCIDCGAVLTDCILYRMRRL